MAHLIQAGEIRIDTTTKTIAENISWLMICNSLSIVSITSSIPALGITPTPKIKLS